MILIANDNISPSDVQNALNSILSHNIELTDEQKAEVLKTANQILPTIVDVINKSEQNTQ